MRYKIIKYKFLALFCTIFILSCNNDDVEPIDCVEPLTDNNITYVDGKKFTGQCYIYAADGIIVRLRSYKRGKLNGIQKGWYHPDRELAYVGYRKNGEIHGEYTGYYKNGSQQAEGRFKRGHYDRKWLYYNENEQLVMEKSFYNGKVIDSTLIIP